MIAGTELFEVLGIDEDAPAEIKKKAVRQASLRWHPDKFIQVLSSLSAVLRIGTLHVVSDPSSRHMDDECQAWNVIVSWKASRRCRNELTNFERDLISSGVLARYSVSGIRNELPSCVLCVVLLR